MRKSRHNNTVRNQPKSALPRLLRAIVVGVVGAWVAIVLWGGVNGDLGIVSVRAALRPAIIGRTELEFPPLGSVSARTHLSPIALDLRIDQVHIVQTAEWLKQHKSPVQTADMVETGIKRIAYRLAWLSVIVALVGSSVACLLFRVGSRLFAGTAVGGLSVIVPLAIAAMTYNPAAFDNPEFHGEMAKGPHLLNLAQAAWQSNAGIVRDIPRIASRTAALCQQLEQAGFERLGGSQTCTRVLLISDLHNNPVGVRFALDLAQTYQPGMVLVAGDFTDLGHPLEPELLAGLKKFQIPIVGVAGNHDSRATVRVLSTIPHMIVLDNGQCAQKAGLSIMGFGDPAARRPGTGSVDTSRGKLKSLTRRISSALRRKSPDILLVHNNDVARSIAGEAPMIADGHLHKASVQTRSGSVLVNPGTTGAAGVRYFSSAEKPSYTAALLQFDSRRRLRKVDSIRMELPSGDFEVKRQSVSGR